MAEERKKVSLHGVWPCFFLLLCVAVFQGEKFAASHFAFYARAFISFLPREWKTQFTTAAFLKNPSIQGRRGRFYATAVRNRHLSSFSLSNWRPFVKRAPRSVSKVNVLVFGQVPLFQVTTTTVAQYFVITYFFCELLCIFHFLSESCPKETGKKPSDLLRLRSVP